MTPKHMQVFIIAGLTLVLSVLTLVNAHNFGVSYTITSKTASFSFPGAAASSACSLVLGVDRNSTDTMTIKVNNYPTTSYSNRLNSVSYSLMGVSGLTYCFNSTPVNTDFTFYYICTQGILNVNPLQMALYTLNSAVSYYFVSTDSSPSNAAAISYTFKTQLSINSTLQGTLPLLGFAAIVDAGSSTLGPYYNFNGPYQFSYTLRTNRYNQMVESMTYTLPNAKPNFNSYALSISQSSTYYQKNGYTPLYGFSISTIGSPYTYGATLKYSYPTGNNFFDVNGNSILIQPNSLACFCSTDGYYFGKTSASITSSGLTCGAVDVNSCQYITIAAKPVAVASSSGPNINSATTMYSGSYVYTNTIYSKVYYKINVPSGYTLTLKSISLYSSSSNNGYVTINADSDYNSNQVYVYSYNQYSTLSYTNYNTYSKTVYVAVQPYSTSTRVQFIPYLSNYYSYGWGYRLPVIITTAVVFPLFGLIAIVVVIVTIKRNSKRPQI